MNADEALGRSEFSGKAADRARAGKPIRPETFLVRERDETVSVDRLDDAPESELAGLASSRGRERTPPKPFQGWAVVTVSDAETDGRTVEATPTETNPYHADIRLNLPPGVPDRRRLQKLHAVQLAARATWRNAPVRSD